jgi:transposase
MSSPYSVDLRKRVMKAIHQGMKKTVACEMFTVCKQTLYNWIALEKKQGHLAPLSGFQQGHSHKIKDMEAFRCYVDEHADYTLVELAKHFKVGKSTIGRALIKLGYSRKKRANPILSATTKSGVTIKRRCSA